MSGNIRLACTRCDRDDFDGVDLLPNDWIDAEEMPWFREQLDERDVPDSLYEAFLYGHTHLGVCPDCQLQRRSSLCQ